MIFDDHAYTVTEAAYLTGVARKKIDREIDDTVIDPVASTAGRRLDWATVLYLAAIDEVRAEIRPRLRRDIWRAVCAAVAARKAEARVGPFVLDIRAVVDGLKPRLMDLTEVRAAIDDGEEAVLKGTGIPASRIAGRLEKGASPDAVMSEFGLSPDQLRAVDIHTRLHPKRGRPSGKGPRRQRAPATR